MLEAPLIIVSNLKVFKLIWKIIQLYINIFFPRLLASTSTALLHSVLSTLWYLIQSLFAFWRPSPPQLIWWRRLHTHESSLRILFLSNHLQLHLLSKYIDLGLCTLTALLQIQFPQELKAVLIQYLETLESHRGLIRRLRPILVCRHSLNFDVTTSLFQWAVSLRAV